MNDLFQHFINGLTLGSVYSLIALGYTMVYGILGFINFAHGEVSMIGAYVALVVYHVLQPNQVGFTSVIVFFVAIVISAMLSFMLGIGIEKVAYRPLRHSSRLAPLLSAIGVSFILSNFVTLIFESKSRKFDYPFDNTSIDLGFFIITPHQILNLVVSLILMLSLSFFISKTLLGKAMRATSIDMETAQLMGINIDFIISLTFAIGSALAAIGGVLVSFDYKVYPTMGTLIGLKSFVAAVVGGIGSIKGAMLGGIILGLLETFCVAFLGVPQGYKDAISFGILIIVLVIKPSGIMGIKKKEKV